MDSDIVIVGGGAGGLELACKLGRKLGPARVTLVDRAQFHVWKPSLHEVAAGTLDIHQEGLSYQMLGHDNGFAFVCGPMTALNTVARQLTVGALVAGGEQVLPSRELNYGTLVIAVGSVSNYFGVPGADAHTISLNATDDAEHFRLAMLKLLTQAEQHQRNAETAVIDIVIIGAGATGVELAAELREASSAYAVYGFGHAEGGREVHITLLEGAARILAPLPERVSNAALRLLKKRNITVVTGCQVSAVGPGKVSVVGAPDYAADLCVWAAGIKAPALLGQLGLPVTAKGGQVEVDAFLRVRGVEHLFALGDCAACVDAAGHPVPPRAQAAHQQASYLFKVLLARSNGRSDAVTPFRYRDYGSLVSIGQSTTVGNLMGALRGARWFVEGSFARLMYVSLHLLHHQAVLGTLRTGLLALARFLIKRGAPLVKLH